MKRLAAVFSVLLLAGCGDTPSQPAVDVQPSLDVAPLPTSSSSTIDWVDWTSYNYTLFPYGYASGNIGALTVGYSGELYPLPQTSGGINFWIPRDPYLSPTVTNEPATPDIIRLRGLDPTVANQITFSAPVTNPIMAIVSLGRLNQVVRYHFDAPFDVLSYGPGYFGGPGTLTELPGNVLEGEEGHGVVQFLGIFTSVSWTAEPYENWHGFTVGTVHPITVTIDIKPGSYPNCFNNDGHGVIPVAILGTADFDVMTVDPATVSLEGMAVGARGKSSKLMAHIEDVNGDVYADLVVQIEDVDGTFTVGAGLATLTGNLKAEFGGWPFEGTDEICIVPPEN